MSRVPNIKAEFEVFNVTIMDGHYDINLLVKAPIKAKAVEVAKEYITHFFKIHADPTTIEDWKVDYNRNLTKRDLKSLTTKGYLFLHSGT